MRSKPTSTRPRLVPERWVGVLDRLSDAHRRGRRGALEQPRRQSGLDRLAAHGADHAALRRRAAGASTTRAMRPRSPRGSTRLAALHHRGRSLRLRRLPSSDPFFTDFMLPEGLGWSASTAVNVPDHDLLALSVERAWRQGPDPAGSDRSPGPPAPAPRAVGADRGAACLRAGADGGRRARPAWLCGRRRSRRRAACFSPTREFEAEGGGWTLGARRPHRHCRRTDRRRCSRTRCTRLEHLGGVRSIPLPPRGGKDRCRDAPRPDPRRGARPLRPGAGAFSSSPARPAAGRDPS